MKRLARLEIPGLSILIAACMMAVLVGCSTPMEKAWTTSTLYSQAQHDLIDLKPNLSPAQFNAAADADKIATPLVLEMNRAAVEAQTESIPLGKTYNFNVAWDAARKAVNTFLLRVAESKTK